MIRIKRKRKRVGIGKVLSNGNKKTWLLVVLLSISIAFNLLVFYRMQRKDVIPSQIMPVSPEQQQSIPSTQLVGGTNIIMEQDFSPSLEPADANSTVADRWLGLCAKNSVRSIEDFYEIVHADPLLASHFSDFDWDNAMMGTLEESVWTHIAYRKNDRIHVTRKAIRLPGGDGYITDGIRWVRTYCCNDYVRAPFGEGVDTSTPPDVKKKSTELNTVVPEPMTLILCISGFVLFCFFYGSLNKNKLNRKIIPSRKKMIHL